MEVLPEEVFSQLKAEGRVFAVVGKRPVMAAQLVTVECQRWPSIAHPVRNGGGALWSTRPVAGVRFQRR